MPDTETRKMAVDEIALMREIVKWRRNHGIEFYRARRTGRWVEWIEGPGGRSVVHENTGEAEFSHGPRSGTHDRIDVRSVTQAVDILVAFGYLPPRFSSVYRAGWEASRVWHANDRPLVGDEEVAHAFEFKRLFHNPLNVSFPAPPERGRP